MRDITENDIQSATRGCNLSRKSINELESKRNHYAMKKEPLFADIVMVTAIERQLNLKAKE